MSCGYEAELRGGGGGMIYSYLLLLSNFRILKSWLMWLVLK